MLHAAADHVLPGNGGDLSGNTTKGVSKISQFTIFGETSQFIFVTFPFLFVINENLCVKATQFQVETVFKCVECLIIFSKL